MAALQYTAGGKSQAQLGAEYASTRMDAARKMQVVAALGGYSPHSAEQLSALQKRLARIVNACPALHDVCYAPLLWFNRHLQLVPFMLRNYWHKFVMPPVDFLSQRFALEDGEELVLDWALPASSSCAASGTVPQSTDPDASAACTVLLLHHGAYCRSNDMPGYLYVQDALRKGWLVMCVNRRGHRGRLQQPKFSFFGSCSDVRHIVERCVLAARPNARVVMLGISAGSGIVARYMGEQGLAIKQLRQRAASADGGSSGEDRMPGAADAESDEVLRKKIYGYVHSVVGVAPGYNIEVAMGRFGFPYNHVLMSLGKAFFFHKNAPVLLARTGDDRADALRQQCYARVCDAGDFQEWLDESYAFANTSPCVSQAAAAAADRRPRQQSSGVFHIDSTPPIDGKVVPGATKDGPLESKEEFYDYFNPMRVVEHIVNPCLFINAEDDPLCLARNVYEALPMFDQNAHIGAVVVKVKTGSHCSFLQGQPWQPWDCTAWSETAASQFLEQALL